VLICGVFLVALTLSQYVVVLCLFLQLGLCKLLLKKADCIIIIMFSNILLMLRADVLGYNVYFRQGFFLTVRVGMVYWQSDTFFQVRQVRKRISYCVYY